MSELENGEMVKIRDIGAYNYIIIIGIESGKTYKMTFTKVFPEAKTLHSQMDVISALSYIMKIRAIQTRFGQT